MVSESIEVRGHIIDSLILPKILDEIMNRSGGFEIEEIRIGARKEDPSYARLKIMAPSSDTLESILSRIQKLGATLLTEQDAQPAQAPQDGVFPEDFYCTTNLPTAVRMAGKWVEAENIEMDCGILVDLKNHRALCRPITEVRKGDTIVVGNTGIRVTPLERAREKAVFRFMDSSVSSEKPKSLIVREIAEEIRSTKASGRKVLVVAGPAVIHTGGAPHLACLIEGGFVDILFGGNGLAAHDIEYSIFGTSLGVYLDTGIPAKDGHDHHMRAINLIRSTGGIHQAVEKGILKNGVMHACTRKKIDYVLAGSIRDDGPIPDVITDVIRAQGEMRKRIQNVGLALMLASTLHSIATGNLLPATVKTFCVDINPAVVTKVADRGTFQILGLVMDCSSFLRELSLYLLGPSVG